MPIQTCVRGGGMDTTGWDRDVLAEMPKTQYIGHRRLYLRHCIQPQMQVLSPNIHSNLCKGGGVGDGRDRTGQDRMG